MGFRLLSDTSLILVEKVICELEIGFPFMINFFRYCCPGQIFFLKSPLENVFSDDIFKMLIQDIFLWDNLESWSIVFFEVVKDLLECKLSQDQIVDVHELKEVLKNSYQE